MAIEKIEVYRDENNRTVTSFTEVNNPDNVRYVGSVVIRSDQGNVPIEFPINAFILEDAFADFDNQLKEFVTAQKAMYEAAQAEESPTENTESSD